MDQVSQQKIIKAGFTIIRTDDTPSFRIKHKTKDVLSWVTLEKFTTKAARDRKFNELLIEPMIIAD
nr:hypothetical protein [uncultured Bacteroides sp.]